MNKSMINGAIIVQDSPDLDAIISLLSLRLSDKLKYRRYTHANELNFEEQFDFIMLGNVSTLARVVHLFEVRNRSLPLIIHLAHPSELKVGQYGDLFPGVHVVPIAQADLDEMDETLQILLFETVLHELGK